MSPRARRRRSLTGGRLLPLTFSLALAALGHLRTAVSLTFAFSAASHDGFLLLLPPDGGLKSSNLGLKLGAEELSATRRDKLEPVFCLAESEGIEPPRPFGSPGL